MLDASLELCGGGAGVLRRGFCTQHQSRGVSPLAALRCARAAALEALPAPPPPPSTSSASIRDTSSVPPAGELGAPLKVTGGRCRLAKQGVGVGGGGGGGGGLPASLMERGRADKHGFGGQGGGGPCGEPQPRRPQLARERASQHRNGEGSWRLVVARTAIAQVLRA